MSKPSERKRAKHDKRRAAAKQRAKDSQLPTRPADLVALAATKPFGPCWIAQSYDDAQELPSVVQVVVTRRIRGDLLLPACVLVDRTCLGIKNGFPMEMGTSIEVAQDLEAMGHEMGDPLRPCEVLLAQSVVFHALDYAHSLGFAPHRDAPMVMFGPRPEVLLDTPHARPARPFYVEGLEKNARSILARLDNAVGPGNYDVVLRDELDDDELDDDDEGEDDLLRVNGEPFIPVRLFYEIADAEDARARLGALRAEVVVTDARTLTVELPTCDDASAAAQAIAARLDARPHRVRIVNRCFAQDEGTPDELAKWLDRDVTIVDGVDREDVPLVEEFALEPDVALDMLALALRTRYLRALRHWAGDTDVTLGDIVRVFVERVGGGRS